MKIELLYFEGCPNFQPTLSLVQQVLDEEKIPVKVKTIPVESDESAIEHQFLGSPSIRVDGQDIERSARTASDFGMKCRIYDHDGVPSGVPSKSNIRKALHEAGNQLM